MSRTQCPKKAVPKFAGAVTMAVGFSSFPVQLSSILSQVSTSSAVLQFSWFLVPFAVQLIFVLSEYQFSIK